MILSPAALRSRVGSAATLTCGEFINKGSRFVLIVLLARAFGAAEYGVWVLAAACGMILASGGDLGLSTVVTRRSARTPKEAQRYVAGILALVPLIIIAVTIGLAALAAVPDLAPAPTRLLVPLGVAGMLDSATFLLLAPLRGMGRVAPEAAIRAAQGISLLAGCSTLLAFGADLAAVAWVLPTTSAIMLLASSILLVRTFGHVRPHLDAPLLRDLLRESLPVAAAAVTVLVYFRIDAFLIAWLRDDSATGVYGAAYSLAFGVTFIPAMFQRAHLPRFASLRSHDELRSELWRRLRVSAAVASITTGALLLLTPFVPRLYGHGFTSIWVPYAILSCAQAVFFLNNVLYTVLLARARTGTVWGLSGLRLVANVAANIMLIPILGVAGAALAAVLSELVLLGAQGVVVRVMLARAGMVTPFATDVDPRYQQQPAA